jgi:hypothetical protein
LIGDATVLKRQVEAGGAGRSTTPKHVVDAVIGSHQLPITGVLELETVLFIPIGSPTGGVEWLNTVKSRSRGGALVAGPLNRFFTGGGNVLAKPYIDGRVL